MTALRDALFRIEPTRGLVSYTEDVKPYHTKILDVLIEYVYEEKIDVTVTEKWKWEIHWDERWDANRDGDWLAGRTPPTVTYSCGYGIVWDHASSADFNPTVLITDISPASHRVASITPTAGVVPGYFTMTGKVVGDFPTGSKFRVKDSTYSNSALTTPPNIIEFTVASTPVYVNGRTRVPVVETLLPATNIQPGTAYAMVDRFNTSLNPPANSFLVSATAPTLYSFMVRSLDSNQLAIADRVVVVGVNPTLHTWTISGNKVDDIEIGMSIHITSNTINANGIYTVANVVLSAGNTVITVNEPIFTTALPSGFLAFPIKPIDEYNIVGIDTANKQITVAGDHLTGIIANQELVITGNGTQDPLHPEYSADGRYIVTSATLSAGNTVITVKNTLMTTSLSGGIVNIERLPGWMSGTQVALSGTGVPPAPLATAGTYYFQPVAIPGVFTLGYKRYPTEYGDIANITTLGVGDIKISRGELYYPGAVITVDNTYNDSMRGNYYVKNTVVEGAYTRVYVMQHVDRPHGGDNSIAGTITMQGIGFGEPTYCPLAGAPSLYTDTFIDEHLTFVMSTVKRDNITTEAIEYQRRSGWGVSPYAYGGTGAYGTDSFTDIPNRFAMTSGAPGGDGAHLVLPTGYDTQLWDIGGMGESYSEVWNFYGRVLP